MRVSQQEMDASHRRIVEGAARLFRENGVRGASVADAMNAAGMTHGGFYRHFDSKDALVVEAMQRAFDEFVGVMESRQAVHDPAEVLREFRAIYLSDEHVANPGQGCPMPAIGADVGREKEDVRAAFSAGLERVVDAVAKGLEVPDARARDAAYREVALLVGAVVLARATSGRTTQALLRACRAGPVDGQAPR